MNQTRGLVVPRVPGKSRVECEYDGVHIVRDYRPQLLVEPGAFPVRHFFEFYLVTHYGLKTGPAELPYGVEGATGSDRIIRVTDSVFEGLENNGFHRMTAIHEAVHGICHVPILEEIKCEVANGGMPILHRRTEIPAYADPEWQARRIAAAVLMPLPAVWKVIDEHGESVKAIRDAFVVSSEAASIRLLQARDLARLRGRI